MLLAKDTWGHSPGPVPNESQCGWSGPHSSHDCKTHFSDNHQGMLKRQGLLLTGVGGYMPEVVGREGENAV